MPKTPSQHITTRITPTIPSNNCRLPTSCNGGAKLSMMLNQIKHRVENQMLGVSCSMVQVSKNQKQASILSKTQNHVGGSNNEPFLYEDRNSGDCLACPSHTNVGPFYFLNTIVGHFFCPSVPNNLNVHELAQHVREADLKLLQTYKIIIPLLS